MEDLKKRQTTAAQVEKYLLDFLVQFEPAGNLKLADAKVIASMAREIAFNAFCPPVIQQ